MTPAEELVALLVAFVFTFNIAFECDRGAGNVNLNGVVDDHFSGGQWVNQSRVATEVSNCFTHRCEVHDAGNAGEILHDDARRGELDFGVRLTVRIPRCERFDVLGSDVCSVFGAQQVFCKNLQRVRKLVEAIDRVKRVNRVVLRINAQGGLCSE